MSETVEVMGERITFQDMAQLASVIAVLIVHIANLHYLAAALI